MKKHYKKFIFVSGAILILAVFGFLGFGKKESVKAQEEVGVVCDKVIPIGEAAGKTIELYNNLFKEGQNINKEVENEIKTAYAILEAIGNNAENCDTSKCTAVCTNISLPLSINFTMLFFSVGNYPACVPVCGPVQDCIGIPCPEIRLSVNTFIASHQKITTSAQNVKNLIGPITERKDTEPVTDDIKKCRRWLKIFPVCEHTVEECVEVKNCPVTKIPLTEWIKRKLEKARVEFRECAVPRSDWPKFSTKGLYLPDKGPKRCKDVIASPVQIKWAQSKCQNICDPTKASYNEEECLTCLCYHPENWFCCHAQ
jgi:hypothetical protein